MVDRMAINILSRDEKGLLRNITSAIFEHGGNITYTQQFIIDRGKHRGKADIYMEVEG
ncbi:MAG: Amino acid-binding ACT domain protein, partial [Methanosarcinales archeaon 56_1174]